MRLRDGDGLASLKAGFRESREALLLPLLPPPSGGQRKSTGRRPCRLEHPVEGSLDEGAGELDAAWPRGLVLGKPWGHSPWR